MPLQSGSDRILAAMHRGYNTARYRDKLALARDLIPDLSVSTDIIVGFPGETEDDFPATLDMVERSEFDQAFMFIFSPRPGTRAAAMVEHFVPARGDSRSDSIGWSTLQNRISLERNQAMVGRVEVLAEGPSRKDPTWPPPGPAAASSCMCLAASPPGHFLEVEITAAAPHHLIGNRLTRIVAMLGPTASGKSEVALELAAKRNGSRSCRSTACRCIGGWTSAPPSRLLPSGRGPPLHDRSGRTRHRVHRGRVSTRSETVARHHEDEVLIVGRLGPCISARSSIRSTFLPPIGSCALRWRTDRGSGCATDRR